MNFRYLPFMLLTAIAGILLISLFHFAFSIVAFILFAIAAIIVACTKNSKIYLPRIIVLLITFLIFVFIGGAWIVKAKDVPDTIYDAIVVGTITSDSDITGEMYEDSDNLSYRLYLKNCSYTTDKAKDKLDGVVRVYVNLPYDKTFTVGDVITVKAHTVKPSVVNISNSVKIRNFIGNNLWQMNNAEFVEIQQKAPNFQETIKVRARDAMIKYVPAGGILYSIIFGDKIAMSDDFNSASKVTGIAHVFAVSGLHLGFVAGIASFISKKCKANKIVDYFLVLIVTGLYALLVGFGPSVSRAFLMITIYKSGNLFGVRHCGISSLSLSALIMLIVSPLTIFNLSFQLSVMAISGILFFQKPISRMIKTKWKFFNGFVSVNFATNIALLPIMLHYFGRVSLIFFLANLLIVPYITLIFPLIFVIVLLSAIYAPIAYVLVPFGFIFNIAEIILIALAKVPFLSINFSLNFFWVAAYIAFMVVISSYSLLSKRLKAILAVAMCLVLTINVVLTSFGRLDGSVKLETVTSNENADIIMLDIKNEHYLFVNGELTEYIFSVCRSYMAKNNIIGLDGVVKADVRANELLILSKIQSQLSAKRIITSSLSSTVMTIFDGKVYQNRTIGDYVISVIDENVLQLTSDNCNTVFISGDVKEEQLPQQIDIMYCAEDVQFENFTNLQYLVSDKCVEKHIPQSVNSYFTFIIKGAKIEVT